MHTLPGWDWPVESEGDEERVDEHDLADEFLLEHREVDLSE